MRGALVLEDGTVLVGETFGAAGTTSGEVVFNTGMTGYQEVLTDPSYAGQIVVMTYPLIGNYGINLDDSESLRPRVRGFIVREACSEPSHWRAVESVDAYLKAQGIIGLFGIDTRDLTRHLRKDGTLRGVMTTDIPQDGELPQAIVDGLVAVARQIRLDGVVAEVTTRRPYRFELPEAQRGAAEAAAALVHAAAAAQANPGAAAGGPLRVAVLDFGVKHNILRELARRGCEVTVLPASTGAAEVLALHPDGVLLSNGPGDPKDVPGAISATRTLVGQVPIFGICLGHQILALSLGADTYRLKYGHRGSNHPVKQLDAGRITITTQNHGYAIRDESLAELPLTVTHRNLNDGTVEGMEHQTLPVFSVQYHPEAGPGPEDSGYLFDRFLDRMREHRQARLALAGD